MTDPSFAFELADREQRRKLHARITNDVAHHPPGDLARPAHEQIRRETERLAHLYVEICPPGRELSLALTKLLDEAMAHANAAVARNHGRLTEPAEHGAGLLEWSYDPS
jgi:hypothetical protein